MMIVIKYLFISQRSFITEQWNDHEWCILVVIVELWMEAISASKSVLFNFHETKILAGSADMCFWSNRRKTTAIVNNWSCSPRTALQYNPNMCLGKLSKAPLWVPSVYSRQSESCGGASSFVRTKQLTEKLVKSLWIVLLYHVVRRVIIISWKTYSAIVTEITMTNCQASERLASSILLSHCGSCKAFLLPIVS